MLTFVASNSKTSNKLIDNVLHIYIHGFLVVTIKVELAQAHSNRT